MSRQKRKSPEGDKQALQPDMAVADMLEPETIIKTEEEYKDELISSMISVLNVLIAKAAACDMGMAARILYTAKEEMVHWAVDMDFHETAKDRFINRHLYDKGAHGLGEFIARFAAIQDEGMRAEIIRLLGLSCKGPDELEGITDKSVPLPKNLTNNQD